MGWSGYGIYSGDDTQTCHYGFIQTAGIESDEDKIYEWMGYKSGTIIPKEKRHLLIDNADKILKTMPKLVGVCGKCFRDEEDAIEYQMLLALYLDNKLTPPPLVYKLGVDATDYLYGEHAEGFNEPCKRKRSLRNFLKKAEKYK